MLHLLKPMIGVKLMRTIVKSPQRPKCSIPPKMQRLQRRFQEKNNLPVHLKGGALDKMLYLSTLGLSGCGLFGTLVFLAGYIID